MTKLKIRNASLDDLAQVIKLLKDDELGRDRESANLVDYQHGLRAIIESVNDDFLVAIVDHEIVGCFQLTIIPSLSRGASKRAQIESVRVKSCYRGKGYGQEMMRWAIDFSANEGCRLVQLTTDKTRNLAHDIYTGLGFEPSHVGMKLNLK